MAPPGGQIKFLFHTSNAKFPSLSDTETIITPPPYKRTGDISVSPVQQQQFFVARPVFSGNFPRFSQCFSLKNTKKLSPVHSRPSCPAPKLVARLVFRPSFYTGGVYFHFLFATFIVLFVFVFLDFTY